MAPVSGLLARTGFSCLSERSTPFARKLLARTGRLAAASAKLLVNIQEGDRRPHPLPQQTAPRPRLLNAERRSLIAAQVIDFQVQRFSEPH